MFGLGLPEILILALIAGILLFGSKKMVDLARSTGRLTGEFKKGRMEMEKELREAEKEIRDTEEPKREDHKEFKSDSEESKV